MINIVAQNGQSENTTETDPTINGTTEAVAALSVQQDGMSNLFMKTFNNFCISFLYR